jgi:hypothetical protein
VQKNRQANETLNIMLSLVLLLSEMEGLTPVIIAVITQNISDTEQTAQMNYLPHTRQV